MAHKLGLSEIKDLINLTFCCQKITVITDFSDLEKIGREHYMNLNGGCARTEDLEALDGTETAYLLIDSEAGTVTPYGVVYDNGMKLEPLYNGRQFPEYLYDNSGMGLKIVPAENQAPELLWLPASEQQIRRTLLRTGWQDPDHADYTIDVFLLQKEVGEILDEKRDSLDSLNAMCGAIAKLDQKDRAKLEAVIIFAEPENAGEICRLAENLDQFDFIPGVHTPKEYGKYMIQESGRFGYGKITLKGLQNPMLGTIIMAYIMAGMLAQLLRQSGLIDALIWGITRLGLNAGWIPMIAFLTCVLISTSCGTSTGSVAAVAPVLLPLAHGLGINMGLMCGAIISGAIFGDNLAPISDTTISSALTQEADISQVVRTRFPYAAISGAVAAVLFAVVGLTQDANIPADLELDGSTAKSLFLLVLPVLMVILMRKGWDLMGTLILCNLSGIVLNLVLGTIAPAKMFANDGPIVAGMSGMMTLVLYVTLLFQLLEILNSSGAFDGLTVSLMKHCKSPRSGELICYLAAALGSVVTGGSGIAIVFFGSLVRRITKAFHIDRCRGANILDGVACGATGLMPHGNPTLVSLGVALAIDGVDPNFSFLDIIPYNFHCWGLMLIFLLSILTGIGRRFEKPEETANA